MKRKLFFTITILFLSSFTQVFANQLFTDSFETSTPGSLPIGWHVDNPGVSIIVLGSEFYDGNQSLFMRGVPYGGSNLSHDLEYLNMPLGTYYVSSAVLVDTVSWTGNDGAAALYPTINYMNACIGVMKIDGIYRLYTAENGAHHFYDFFGDINDWNQLGILFDLTSGDIEYYFNSTFLSSTSAHADTRMDTISLGAGSAGSGGGYPSVYFDSVSICSVAPVPEPATMLLLGSGIIGLAGIRRRLNK